MSPQSPATRNLASWFRRWRLWLGVASLILVAVALEAIAWAHATNPRELIVEGILTNLVTAMLGVLLGVPIAVYIALWQLGEQRRDEDTHQEAKRNEQAVAAAARRQTVIGLLNQEIKNNLTTLRFHANLGSAIGPSPGSVSQYRPDMPAAPLSTELWRVVGPSGELTDADPDLLYVVANAYRYTQVMDDLEREYVAAARSRSTLTTDQIQNQLDYYAPTAIDWAYNAFNATT